MKTKHTPGPWGYELGAVVDSGDFIIADVRSRWDDGMDGDDYHFANARLMASAPDLLDALEWLIQDEPADSAKRGVIYARAAIAKARGE